MELAKCATVTTVAAKLNNQEIEMKTWKTFLEEKNGDDLKKPTTKKTNCWYCNNKIKDGEALEVGGKNYCSDHCFKSRSN